MGRPPRFDPKDVRRAGSSPCAGGRRAGGGRPYPRPVVGIAQVLVDLEARVGEGFLSELGLEKGGWRRLDDGEADRLYERLRNDGRISHEYAGGGVANTVHDYSVLSGSEGVLFGAIGDPAVDSRRIDLYLQETDPLVRLELQRERGGMLGHAFILVTGDGERTFGLRPGVMNRLLRENVSRRTIEDAAAFLACAYETCCGDEEPLQAATRDAISHASDCGVPVVFSLGNWKIVGKNAEYLRGLVETRVNVLAMNAEEAAALTGGQEPREAALEALDHVDLVLCTAGAGGLVVAGWVESSDADAGRPAGVLRPMLRRSCTHPEKASFHCDPLPCDPADLVNTNGAGDAALAAVVHELVAARLEGDDPWRAGAERACITRSTFAEIAQYASRVAHEIVRRPQARLASAGGARYSAGTGELSHSG